MATSRSLPNRTKTRFAAAATNGKVSVYTFGYRRPEIQSNPMQVDHHRLQFLFAAADRNIRDVEQTMHAHKESWDVCFMQGGALLATAGVSSKAE